MDLIGLLSKLLLASPGERVSISDMKKDRWFTTGTHRQRHTGMLKKLKVNPVSQHHVPL